MSDEEQGKVVSLAERRAAAQARAQSEQRERARRETSERERLNPSAMPTPYVSYTILGLNILVWLVMVGFGVSASSPTGAEMLPWGAKAGPLIVTGQWWRLLTAMFLHGGVWHLAFNMYFLWIIGRVCEQIFSPWAYVLIYLGSGVIGSLVALAWSPMVVSYGASGALFGVFGAFLAFTIRRRGSLPPDYVKGVQRSALILIALNLAMGLLSEGISLAAHLGGLNAGLGIGYLLTRLAEQPVTTREQALALRRRSIALTAMITTAVAAIGAGGVYYLLAGLYGLR